MPSELDVFIKDSNFYIEKIQINIISDFEIDDKSLLVLKKTGSDVFNLGK